MYYDDSYTNVILPSQSFTLTYEENDNGWEYTSSSTYLGLVVGDTYSVSVDGTNYDVTCVEEAMNTTTFLKTLLIG